MSIDNVDRDLSVDCLDRDMSVDCLDHLSSPGAAEPIPIASKNSCAMEPRHYPEGEPSPRARCPVIGRVGGEGTPSTNGVVETLASGKHRIESNVPINISSFTVWTLRHNNHHDHHYHSPRGNFRRVLSL